MTALDTNVLVRFLVQDDQAQFKRVIRRFQAAVEDDRPFFVANVVLCETVWVLTACYNLGRAEISSALHKLLSARHLEFHQRDVLIEAVEAYSSGKGDFADYLIRAYARAAGQEPVLTFDKSLLSETGFEQP